MPSSEPSNQPTEAPTSAPSDLPSTMAPAVSPVAVPAVPLPFAFVSASGNVYAASQFTPGVGTLTGNLLAGQTLTSDIVDVTGSSSLNFWLSGMAQSSTISVTFAYPSPANIAGILKTPKVYKSNENSANTVYVVYSVTDAQGRSQCDPSGVSVMLHVGTASAACSVFSSSQSPMSSCMLPVDSALFGTAASTQPVSVELWVNSVLVQTSLLGTVSLAAEPTKTTPSAVGVYFAIPTYSAVPGDMISVPMWAQTGSPTMTMGSWGVSLVYDSLLLTFNSVDHPLYTTVLTSQIVTNALNITGSGGAGIISGWFLAATLYFTVNVAAAGQTVSISMPAILTNAMYL
jgi:hypothetical protein